MAHSVEGRTPLLDPVVAKAIWPLPEHFKVRDGYGKWLLRRWLQDALPQARPFAPKQGFTVPVGPWIEKQAHRLGPLVARQPCIRAMMPAADVERLFARASQRGVARQAWTLLFSRCGIVIISKGSRGRGYVRNSRTRFMSVLLICKDGTCITI